MINGDGWAIRTVLTPGHAANHAAFALEGTGILFSADHVMAWATSIVAPPDGAMADYMASLDRLIERGDRLLLPGHGGPVTAPRSFMRGLRTHRKMRERAILERIRGGDRTIKDMVEAIYRDTDPRLHGAAGLSVLAHLEDLVARGLVMHRRRPGHRRHFHAGHIGSDQRCRALLGRRRAHLARDLLVEFGEEIDDAGRIVAKVVAAVARGRAHVDDDRIAVVADADRDIGWEGQERSSWPGRRSSPRFARRPRETAPQAASRADRARFRLRRTTVSKGRL